MRVARWTLLMQDFNYTIEHRLGRSMHHVDALSRNALPSAMLATECPGTILARIHRNQMDDEELMIIRNKIDKHHIEKYITQNGQRLIVIPKLMQDSLMRQIHERGF